MGEEKDIAWDQIRATISRIDQELTKAQRLIADTDPANDWPEVTRADLEGTFPNWKRDFGNNWMRDFMERKVGRENFRVKPGAKGYRIDPRILDSLQREAKEQGG